jgi:type I restriction enzyme S subunit
MNSWKKVSDFVTFSTKGITPKYVEESSIIVLNQKCIRNNRIDLSFAQYADAAKISSDSKFIKVGDILINSTGIGTAGRCAFVSEIPEGYRLITDSHIMLMRCRSYHEAKCLNFALFSFEKTLMSFMTGSSGQSELDKVVLFNLKVKMPNDAFILKQISSTLSNLELKIELNNRINTDLEAMAKTLYDYWFVQFDFPDANGKPYKTSGGKMVWNEELKRDVPEGWEVWDLEKVESNIITGKTPSTANESYFNGDVPFICIGDVRGNMHIVETEMTLSQAGAETQANKFIPKGSICVTCIASPGLVAFATQNSQTNQQLNSIVCSEFYNKYYLYFYLIDYFKYAKAKTGNTFANMNKGDFSTIKIIKPSKEILTDFSTTLESSIDRVLVNSIENKKLADLRDWLLPMLMNGQVKVN